MDSNLLVRLLCGAMAVALLAVIVTRRRKKTE